MAGIFLQTVSKMYRKAVSICVMLQQDCKVKRKLQLHNIKVSSTTVWRYVTNKGWTAWKEKRRCTFHAGMASEEFANFIPKDDRPVNSRDANPLVTIWIIVDETNIQRSSPQNTGLAKTATTLHLENCEFRNAMGARTFYTLPRRKCHKS